MRHARAVSWSTEDHDRELKASGRVTSREVGEWFRSIDFVPDGALVSSAVRTTTTWAEVASAAGFSCPVTSSDALYSAEPDTALDLIRETAPDMSSLVVVGHNPTISSLAQLLDDREGDPDVSLLMTIGFPPAAVARYTFDGEWAELENASARLTHFRPA